MIFCGRCAEPACVVYTPKMPLWHRRRPQPLWFCLSCWYRRRLDKEARMK